MKAVSLDVDAHHDGIALSTAVALQSGKLPYRDYFLMYGILPDVVNALGLWLFCWLSPLLALRSTSLLLLTLTPLLVLGRGGGQRHIALVLSATATYFALNDISYGVPFLPWSNLLLNILLAALIRFTSVSELEVEKAPARFWGSWFTVSVLVSLVKPQYFIVMFLLLPLAPRMVLAKQFAKRLTAFFGIAIIGLVGLRVMMPSLASPAWTFIAELPRSDYWSITLDNFMEFLVRLLRRDLFLVTACFLAGFTFSFSFPIVTLRRNLRLISSGFVLVSVAGSLNRPELSWVASQLDYKSRAPRLLEIALLMLLGGLVGVLAAHLTSAIRARGRVNFKIRRELVLVSIGLAGLTQFAPVPDTRHAWYAVVPAILSVSAILRFRDLQLKSVLTVGVVAVTLSFFVYRDTQSDWQEYISMSRTPATSSVIAGTRSRSAGEVQKLHQQRVVSADRDIRLLEETLTHSEATLFVVDDALFSVFDGTWRSADKWQVEWELTEPLDRRLAREAWPTVIVQSSRTALDLTFVRGLLRDKGYLQIASGDRIKIYKRAEIPPTDEPMTGP